jgi:hypothetical protein
MPKRSIPASETVQLWDAQLKRLYGPVGEITVLWGMIDHLVHYTGFALMKVLGEKGDWPTMMGHRLKMIDKLFRNKVFADLRPTWQRLRKSLLDLQDLRDYLVHGAAVRYDPKKDAILFFRVDRLTAKQLRRAPDFTHARTNLLVSFKMLDGALSDCETLARDFEQLRQRIKALEA